MVEREVVLAKLATIDRCLTRIAEVRDNETTERSRLDIEDITVLNITRAAQATIDLATHVVTTEGFGLPDSVSASFTMLSKHEIIDDALAERLRKMVGFRNVAVHDYQTLDPRIISAIVANHLEDMRAFARRIIETFEIC